MNLVYRTIHGSICYGLNGPTSDLDIRGVFLPHREHVFGLTTGPDTIMPAEDEDTTYWEIRKFVKMCLKANPNALEVLFTEPKFVSVMDPLFKPIHDHRNMFLSRQCENTFGGYAKQQLHRLRNRKGQMASDAALRKDAAHLVRLLIFGQQILDTGTLTTFFAPEDPNRNLLIAIKAGIIKEDEVLEYAERAFDNMKTKGSKLPSEPSDAAYLLMEELVIDAVQAGVKLP